MNKEFLVGYLILFAIAALVSFVLSLVLRGLSGVLRLRAVGKDGKTMPLVGGLAIFLCIFVFFLFLLCFTIAPMGDMFSFYPYFLCFIIPYFLLGLLDDIVRRPWTKLMGFLPAVGFCWLLYFLTDAHFYYYNYKNAYSIPLLLFGTLFFSSSYNLLDNADGHCATAVLGLLCGFVFIPDTIDMDLLLVFIPGTILGFLLLDLPGKAKIRLGNAGGLMLGAAAFFLTYTMACEQRIGIDLKIAFIFAFLAYPLYDTITMILLKAKRWQDPVEHYSHRLMRGGFSLWLVNGLVFLLSGPLPFAFYRFLPRTLFLACPFVIWGILLFADVLAASLAEMGGNSSKSA